MKSASVYDPAELNKPSAHIVLVIYLFHLVSFCFQVVFQHKSGAATACQPILSGVTCSQSEDDFWKQRGDSKALLRLLATEADVSIAAAGLQEILFVNRSSNWKRFNYSS